MALKMSSKQDVFFAKLFGPESPEALQALKYQAAGYDFETSLYSIVASKAGVPVDSLTLTASTISLLNDTLSAVVVAQNKLKIADWLKSLPTFHATAKPQMSTVILTGLVSGANKLVAIKAVMHALNPAVTPLNPLGHAKALVEGLLDGAEEVLLGSYPSLLVDQIVKDLLAKGVQATVQAGESLPTKTIPGPAKVTITPVSQVIPLKEAQALGQKVQGTSPGSVYYCIALTDAVKVAARLSGSAVSLRAEWTQNNADVSKLAAVGMSMKSGYASWHLDAAGVPVTRVIGAFLMDTGIAWQQAVKAGTELVVNP